MKNQVFVGYYGSGKTEMAVNYAYIRASQAGKVALVDLDIVNLYFRSRELKDKLAAAGIEVIVSEGKLALADLPALTPAIYGALSQPELPVIWDVGGDEVGATALGRFAAQIAASGYEMYLVVNTFRPFTRDAAAILKVKEEIEQAARLKITSLVANPNLGEATTAAEVQAGTLIVEEAAQRAGLPLSWVGVMPQLLPEVSELLPGRTFLPLERFMLVPWQKERVETDPRTMFKPGVGNGGGKKQCPE